jgi:uncharacterized damage-inducible protein DinB
MTENPARPPFPSALGRGPAGSFGELAARYLEEYLGKVRFALRELPDDRLWWRPAAGSNSIGNLLLHLSGNLSLWLLAGVGGEPYVRDRAAEFAATGGAGAGELEERLAGVVARCARLLRGLGTDDLRREVQIQGYRVDVLSAAFHAVEHMGYHTGQILVLLKQSLPAGQRVELYPQHRGE